MATLAALVVATAALQICLGAEEVAPWRVHTLFSVECNNYFDWQTVGLMHSYGKAGQPGPITRLLSCTEEEKKLYRGMDLAPTLEVPSMSIHPKTGDVYAAINKPAGIVHWLKHSKDADNVDWVIILDADMVLRGPIIPWKLGAEKGNPVAAYYGYLIGCDNILARLHTHHPELCDKVGGILIMHIDDLRALAPFWLSKTEEVRADKAHWATNLTGDIFGQGWISEMYGYSFGAAEVGLRHKITEDLMIYPGYTPRPGIEPIVMHYGLGFTVQNWSFSKFMHRSDPIVYECNRLFDPPPFPKEVELMERSLFKRKGLSLSIECVNTINEGLLLNHARRGCPKPERSKYLAFLQSKAFSELTKPKLLNQSQLGIWRGWRHKKNLKHDGTIKLSLGQKNQKSHELAPPHPKIHTIFSTECTPYFDWQTVGLMHSFHLSGQPGGITRLLSCNKKELDLYKGHDLAPTHYVPSMNTHPLTGDWYPAINKPASVLHWLNHAEIDAEFVVILDADMIMRGPITPWEFKAERARPVSAPYAYLIGCDNVLAKLHTRHPEDCQKIGGVIIMHIEDLRKFALLWLHKTEEVRADKEHYDTKYTGDVYGAGWISEMYGYSFAAAEMQLKHTINPDIMLYPGYIPRPGVEYRVLHYGLKFSIGNWSFGKADWREDVVNTCWQKFPDPPDPSTLTNIDEDGRRKDLLSIECVKTLNDALELHHRKRNCPVKDGSSHQSHGMDGGGRIWRENHHGWENGNSQVMRKKSLRSYIPISINASSFDLPNKTFRSMRFWLIALWAFSVLGFLATMSMIFSHRKGVRSRKKSERLERRASSGRKSLNGDDERTFIQKYQKTPL